MEKKQKTIFINLGFKEKNVETEGKSDFEHIFLPAWMPNLQRLTSGVSKRLEDLRKGTPITAQQSETSDLRSLLSNEKARILYVIKTEKPGSIYALAKLLKRNFKIVREDLKILEKFGLIKLVHVKEKEREKLKPVLQLEKLHLIINI
jgi:predicted transcriptional regulator